MQRSAVFAALACVAVAAAAPRPVAAQSAPAFGGAELRLGVAFPEDAVAGPSITGEVDLGYAWRPALRVIAGLSHFRANIDREPGGDEGSFAATGFWLGARYDFLTANTTGAYVRAGVTVQTVSADAWDTDVDALLSGTNTGAAVAVGARRTLDARGRLSGTIELRRTALNNMANTALEIGMRLQRRGSAAYTADPVALSSPPRRDARTGSPTPDTPRADPAVPVPAARDTALERRGDEARRAIVEAEQRARTAELEERQARDNASDERLTAAAEERAAAAEALLRQGLSRAAAVMTSATDMSETESAFIVRLSGNAFATGSAALSPPARAELRVLATVLAGYPGHIMSVEGHTDAVGDPAANQRLSLERAGAVRAALIVEGVDPLWSGVRGYGADRPAASNSTASGRAANRRVDIHITKARCPSPPRPSADGGLACPTPREILP
ncbi:MAG TPA: OmpA family protein [Longimicrobiales bacterium]|nr:OmpA family protein [Longimicrobiales bacterium]